MRGKNMEKNKNGGTGNSLNDNEEKSERLFTQEEVNEIIRKRLERNKDVDIAKADQIATALQDLEQREAQLNELQKQVTKRENIVDCKEYLSSKGYSADLIDVLDTSDVEQFKEKADKTVMISNKNAFAPLGSSEPTITGSVPDAFSINFKHKPKDYTTGE